MLLTSLSYTEERKILFNLNYLLFCVLCFLNFIVLFVLSFCWRVVYWFIYFMLFQDFSKFWLTTFPYSLIGWKLQHQASGWLLSKISQFLDFSKRKFFKICVNEPIRIFVIPNQLTGSPSHHFESVPDINIWICLFLESSS